MIGNSVTPQNRLSKNADIAAKNPHFNHTGKVKSNGRDYRIKLAASLTNETPTRGESSFFDNAKKLLGHSASLSQRTMTARQHQRVLSHSASSSTLFPTEKGFSTTEQKLTSMYGSSQPARLRGKKNNPFKTGPVYETEKEYLPNEDWHALINPTRILVTNQGIRTDNGLLNNGRLAEHLPINQVKNGEISLRWVMTNNGSLSIGREEIKLSGRQAETRKQRKVGHPTLVGGMKLPRGRISGMMFADADGHLVINNDSGRFSRYDDRKPEHLDSVAKLLARNGLEVKTEWVAVEPVIHLGDSTRTKTDH